MKTRVFLRKIMILMAAMLPVMTMVSCSDDLPDLPGNPSRHDFTGVTLEIPVSAITRSAGATTPSFLPSNPLQTRAEAAEEEIAGNECNITSLHFFAYPVNDKGEQDINKKTYVCDVTNDIPPLSSEYKSVIVNYELPVGKYKFYVVANYFSDKSVEDLQKLSMSALQEHIVSYTGAITDISANGLPMACRHEDMKDGEDTATIGENPYEITSGENHLFVDLKFTVAKVVFKYDKNDNDPVLENLKITDLSKIVNLFSSFSDFSEYDTNENAISATLGDDNILTVYLPERIVSESKDISKLSFNLEGYEDKTIHLGDAATPDTESTDLPENPTQLLRSHMYEYTLKTSGNELVLKFAVKDWDAKAVKAQLQGPAVLTVSATQLGFGDKNTGDTDEAILADDRPITGNTPRYVYYVSDRSVTFESAKEGSLDILDLTPLEMNGRKCVRVAINSAMPIKTYEGEKQYDETFFYIKAGDLTKKIEVRYNLGGYLEVTPYIENINIEEYRRLESHVVDYEYATNYPNLKCEVSWTENDNYLTANDYKDGWPSGDAYGVYTLNSSLNQNALGKKGIQTVTLGDTYDGYKYTKEITIKFHFTASDASAAVSKDVYLHIIPQAATTYTVYFRATNSDAWTAPHVYVYQPLKKYNSSTGKYEYVMTHIVDSQWENAVQYSITGALTFKGWGSNSANNLVPQWDGTQYKEESLKISGNNGEIYPSDYFYSNIDYIAAHRDKIKNSGLCDRSTCTGGAVNEHKWPGVLMEKVNVNGVEWWRIELPEVCKPGETLLMFSAFHGGMGQDDATKRYPLHMKPGIPLFDFPDREGWCLYDPSKPSDTHFEDDCPDGKEQENPSPSQNKVRIYWDNKTDNWSRPAVYLESGSVSGSNSANWGAATPMTAYTSDGWTQMYYLDVYEDQKIVFRDLNSSGQHPDGDNRWKVVADHVYTSSGDSGKTISNYSRGLAAPFTEDIYLRGFNGKWQSDYPKFTWDKNNGYYITESLTVNGTTEVKVGAAGWSTCEYGKDTSDISSSDFDIKVISKGGNISVNLSGNYKFIFYKSGADYYLKAVKQ